MIKKMPRNKKYGPIIIVMLPGGTKTMFVYLWYKIIDKF